MTKKSFREQMEENDASQRLWGAMFGKAVPQHILNNMPAKREIRNHTPEDQLEGAVKAEVSKIIAQHPRVLIAWRANSGTADLTLKGGVTAPVWFNRIIAYPGPGKIRLPDFIGMTKMGKMFGLECKRRDWKYNAGDVHQKEQKAFLDLLNERNGIGAFVVSAEQAVVALNR